MKHLIHRSNKESLVFKHNLKLQYLYGVVLGELILKHSNNLSKTLQSPKLSASEGQHIAEVAVKTLQIFKK